MKLEKCANGHYFDKDSFDKCPYCKAATDEDADELVALDAEYGFLGKLELFAKGSMGVVYTITPHAQDDNASGAAPAPKYALKVVRHHGNRMMRLTIEKEIHMLALLRRCGHIAQVVSRSGDRERSCVLLEYDEPFSKKWRRTGLTYGELLRLGSDICQAIIECRKQGILHLDIQPKNILVAEDGTFKLCDFSSAQFLSDIMGRRFDGSYRHGTLGYMAPEVFKRGNYTDLSDMYSLGILLYSLINGGMLPFTETCDFETAFNRRMNGSEFPVPECPVPGLMELVMGCCSYYVYDRYPTMKDALRELEDIRENLPESLAGEMVLWPETEDGSGDKKAVQFDSDKAARSILMNKDAREMDRPLSGSGLSMGGAAKAASEDISEDMVEDRWRKGARPKRRWPFAGEEPRYSIREERQVSAERPGRHADESSAESPGGHAEEDFAEESCAGSSAEAVFTFENGDTLQVRTESSESQADSARTEVSHADSVRTEASPVRESYARKAEPEHSVNSSTTETVNISEVEFSAVAPKKLTKGETSIIDLVMYEEAYRKVVDQILRDAEGEVQEKKSGVLEVEKGSRIRIELSSPDLELEDNVEEGVWRGKYLEFNLAVYVPEDFKKRQILLTASVYTDGVPLTKLRFTVKCFSLFEQKLKMIREDVLSGFVSYASQDRDRVASRVQGMLKARPDMNLFFDVDSLRSGDDWERTLRAEIDRRDVLFLFWSKAAKESEWVAKEWKYALNTKGPEVIEPVPMDPPDQCPPPEELRGKHFNDRFLFMTRGS